MDGEDVFGNKITVSRPLRVKEQDPLFKHSSEHQSRARLNTYHGNDDSNQSTSTSQLGPYYCKSTRNNGTAAEMVSPGLSQFGHPPIGSPGFYRSVPPPVFNARTGGAAPGPAPAAAAAAAAPPAHQNGWNRSVGSAASCSASATSGATQLGKSEGNGVFSPSTPPALQPWQTADPVTGATPLDIASQSLSRLTATLPNFQAAGVNARTDVNIEGARRMLTGMQAPRKAQGDGVLWEESGNGYQLKYRSPSPAAASLPMQSLAPSQNLHSSGRSGAGDNLPWPQADNGARVGESKSRTPSPYSMNGLGTELASASASASGRHSWNRTSPYSDEGKESDRYFHPISVPGGSISITPSGRGSSQGHSGSGPVDLQVTNLDQNMDAKELKKMLFQVFREHVMVLHVSVFIQPDGNYVATVKVPSLQDAQFAVSQLHRKKVGFKRIQISYTQAAAPTMNPALIKSQMISLLQDVPGHSLPLFKFRELFESRYLISMSVSDLYKVRDVCIVSEDPSGRMVTLNPKYRNTPSPLLPSSQDGQSAFDLPYCAQHFRTSDAENKGWAEQESTALPNVRIGLKLLAQRIHGLLQTHGGRLPLPSLVYCYEAQYQQLELDESGVPLEHLVSCLPGIEMHQGVGSVKYLRWAVKSDESSHEDGPMAPGVGGPGVGGPAVGPGPGVSCVSPPLAGQLALFSRELVDLLKTTPNCQLSFNRFIPAYHHHFGRQCRVADYGFTKLIQLLEALPNIVQVLGEGSKRVVTLSHRAQVRRFTSDLLRVLKSQYSKQVTVSEFPAAYQRVLNRPFQVVSYGVCQLEDLLAEVSESTVLVTPIADDVLIAIPKREQTHEEIEKTKQFAQEVLQLLRYAPQCSMNFSKFIPYYHHHFGRQCRVADYGFTKLIELFEAIPHIVKISEDEEGERKVRLTLDQRLLVLGDQIASLVESCEQQVVALNVVAMSYLRNYGYALRPQDYDCASMLELMGLIRHVVKVFHIGGKAHIALVDARQVQLQGLVARRILWEIPDCALTVTDFVQAMASCGEEVSPLSLERDLKGVVEVSDGKVRLTPLQVFARNVFNLVCEMGSIPAAALEAHYAERYGVPLQPARYGFSSVKALLDALSDVVTVQRNALVPNSQLAKLKIPDMNGKLKWASHLSYANDSSCNESRARTNQPDSPDTLLKKLIRNISNQPSPSKRVCGEKSTVGYRPFGFGTTQQPLQHHHAMHENFAWGFPYQPVACPDFTVPVATPPVLATPPPFGSPGFSSPGFPSPPRLFAPAALKAAPNDVPLPLVVPPDPSELPMPHMTLVSPPFWSSTNSTIDSQEDRNVDLTKVASTASTACSSEEQGSSSEADCNTSLEANTSLGSLKRKQRLAIQFNSPLIPIQ